MKNIGASVGVVPTRGKKTEEVKEEVKEEIKFHIENHYFKVRDVKVI